jgi:hypothetical protein
VWVCSGLVRSGECSSWTQGMGRDGVELQAEVGRYWLAQRVTMCWLGHLDEGREVSRCSESWVKDDLCRALG